MIFLEMFNNTSLMEYSKYLRDQVKIFIEAYYKKNIKEPCIKQITLDYIKKCRYTDDELRLLLTKLGYEITSNQINNTEFIIPAMASIHSILLSFIPIDDIIDGINIQNIKNQKKFIETFALSYSLNTILEEGGKDILREYYHHLPNYIKIETLISNCIKKLNSSHALEINFHSKIPLYKYYLKIYFKLIDTATSVLIATSFVLGGLIGGADEEIEKIMWDFGILMGRICQIRDDFLDYIDFKVTKKQPFEDLLGKRKRFPLLIAYKVGTKNEKKQIIKIFQKKEMTSKDIIKIMELISSLKVEKETYKIMQKIRKEAENKLNLLPKIEPSKTILYELIKVFSEL
jgi:geranylgeranyl pyrophosphate synthase